MQKLLHRQYRHVKELAIDREALWHSHWLFQVLSWSPHLPTAVTMIAFVTAERERLRLPNSFRPAPNQISSKQNAQHVP
jgi:hypothetical protein